MKINKAFRALAVVFILALVLMLIPAAPVLAQSLSTDISEGLVGGSVRVNGAAYSTNSTLSVFFSSDAARVNDLIGSQVTSYKLVLTVYSDQTGALIPASFTVPSRLDDTSVVKDVRSGRYYVYITYQGTNNILAYVPFTVVAPEITLSPSKGAVGTAVEVSGSGFGSGESLSVKFYTDNTSENMEGTGNMAAGSDGRFRFTVTIPPTISGDHTIRVTGGGTLRSTDATFTVQPEIYINPTSGSANTRIQVTGTGFAGSVSVKLTFAGVQLADVLSDTYGAFSVTINAPALGPGTYEIQGRDVLGGTARATFTVSSTASINPQTSASSPGFAGQPLSLSGTGFAPGGAVTITYFETLQTQTAAVDPNGGFSATFPVPKSRQGLHILTVSDGKTTREFTFFMESTPPPTPTLSKPETGFKVSTETIVFDWADVSDPSGVTYTLQIATTKDFSQGSIVLEKTGLTTSDYTIPPAQMLKSNTTEVPSYYWRVKAIDGAFNESQWSGVGAFAVSGQAGFPQWALYALLGIGAVILFLLGLWLGRASSRS